MDQTPIEGAQSNPVAPASGLTPVMDLVKQSYERAKTYFPRLFPLLAILFGSMLVFNLLPFVGSILLVIILAIVAAVLYLATTIAIIRIIADLEPAQAPDIQSLISRSAKMIPSYLLISVITGLVTLGGLLVFIVPGIIFGVLLCFAPFIFLVEGLRGFKATIRSWQYVKSNWWPVFGRLLVMIVVVGIVTIVLHIILSMIGLGVSSVNDGDTSLLGKIIDQLVQIFVLLPFIMSYMYLLYKSVRDAKMAPIIETEEQSAKTWITVFLVIGAIALILLTVLFVTLAGMPVDVNSSGFLN